MEIICNKCQKKYFIDDSKIPPTGKVYIRCPQCKQKMELKREPDEIPLVTPPQNDEQEPIKPVEYFAPDAKTALIYCKEAQARDEMAKKLEGENYHVRFIRNKNDIRQYFRFNIFDIIILYQHGPDPDDDLLSILNYIHQMPPEIRRQCLVIYSDLSSNKYDFFGAFSKGVDICINPLDIRDLDKLIGIFLEQKNSNYKVFFECKQKVEESL